MVGAQRGETEAPSKAKKYWNLWKQETRLHRFTFYFLFLVGFGLRFAYLFQAVRNDEAYSYLAYSSHSFKTIVTFYNVPNNHIFHNILTHITTGIFGNNLVALRLPVFLCGLAVIPLTYLVIRRVANKNAALLATALVAISSGLINYSTQARGYMIQTFIFLLMVLVGLYLIDTDS
jgi:4-amino-4-deoxy-L-arabinose transferase-like glycosyltransferase